MKRIHVAALVVLLGLLPSAGARTEGVDGETPLVCDLVEASLCDGIASCREIEFAEIDLPPVYTVDFSVRQIASEDGLRTSPIASQELGEVALLLQGTQNGRGWSMVIDRATGHLSATIADVEGAVVIAGACTSR